MFLSQEDRTELAFYWYCILIASISPSHTERGGEERERERLSASFTSQIRYSRYPTHLSTADKKNRSPLCIPKTAAYHQDFPSDSHKLRQISNYRRMTIIIVTTSCCRRLSPAIQYLGKSRISLQKNCYEKGYPTNSNSRFGWDCQSSRY